MGQLSKLPNIGDEIEDKLNTVGIFVPEELYTLGSKEAFVRIRQKDPLACVRMLCALEGAIQRVRWHFLPDATKNDLKRFFSAL